jgi:geranylgeranyl reductase family protein
MVTDTEICIVGAGPAGASLSHFLSKKEIPHILIDKATFPRDKVCGDGITIDVMHTLKRMGGDMLGDFLSHADMDPSWGFCFRSANGRQLRYDFKDAGFPFSPFYTTKRLDLDNYLVQKLDQRYCTFLGNTKVVGLERDEKHVKVQYQNKEGKGEVTTKIIIGAEGEKPIVTRHLGLDHYREKKHLIGAIRVYYKNVKGFHPNKHLEFFFDKDLLPGYFWAFPLPNGEANVGLGMVSTAISKRKVNLKEIFFQMLETHPVISEMFAEAEALEKPKGWGLPTVTPQRIIAGDRYALIGDAAGMIEPFTGKGIGPGMVSGRICSEHLENALKSKNYNMMDYHQHMYRYYKEEIRVGYMIQKTLKYPAVLNSVFSLASISAFQKWSHSTMVKSWKQWM